jgi:hypothetical protein
MIEAKGECNEQDGVGFGDAVGATTNAY